MRSLLVTSHALCVSVARSLQLAFEYPSIKEALMMNIGLQTISLIMVYCERSTPYSCTNRLEDLVPSFDFDSAVRAMYESYDIRTQIIRDYDLGNHSYDTCADFLEVLIEKLNQRPNQNIFSRDFSQSEIFELAIDAISSSGVKFSSVLRKKPQIRDALHGYDYEAVAANPDEVFASLNGLITGQAEKPKKKAIVTWASILANNRNIGNFIATLAKHFHTKHDRHGNDLVDMHVFLCLAATLSKKPYIIVPDSVSEVFGISQDELAFPQMGLTICCEFLRNLGWSGFKPDRLIKKVFDDYYPSYREKFRPEADRILSLSGYGSDAETRRLIQCCLFGETLVPAGMPSSVADNIIWMSASILGHDRTGDFVHP
jgi:3-methyladenine DNA glycosylase Tag